MADLPERTGAFPVGIDLGTTYSSLAYLTPQGQPVTMPNAEGELSTPSVVFFDGDDVIVGTEALRHSVTNPYQVVQFAKRHMGDPQKSWVIDGDIYRPRDISTFVLRKLLRDAQEQLGTIRHAVITVPAQFSELQRRDTVEAGLAAGLERVDLIHEPVAAALCYVLGEGMWFAELASEQTVMVFDLGGGTFDLSLVRYSQQEVRVIASGGDLMLGGLDWNRVLEDYFCDLYLKSSTSDPRLDLESRQALSIEIEQVKRSLSVRPRSSLVIQHEGRRKSFSIDRDQFEALSGSLVDRARRITRELLKSNRLGWAGIDAILATGGSSRMPMIRNMLRQIGGTTLNQSLSPDQSISHGAAFYAGMLHSGQRLKDSILTRQATGRLASIRQQSVSGRSLGILIRDLKTDQRRPHYLIPANTPLPCAYRQRFGTVIPGQRMVHLFIVESGAAAEDPFVELGECVIEGLPEHLPVSSPIEVTIRYDEQARVHVDALVVSSGQSAQVTLIRPPTLIPTGTGPASQRLPTAAPFDLVSKPDQFSLLPESTMTSPSPEEMPTALLHRRPRGPSPLEHSDRPIPLCERCGEAMTPKGICPACKAPGTKAAASIPKRGHTRPPRSEEDLLLTEQISVVLPARSRNKETESDAGS